MTQQTKSFCPYFSVKEYLLYMIQYLSDNKLTFESSLFNTGGEFQHLKITSGWGLRSSMISTYNVDYTAQIYTSFIDIFEGVTLEEMLKNLYKIANISFIVDYSTTIPTFRIERESYFEDNEKILVLENVNDIKERIETSLMYSSIKLGSGKVVNLSAGWTRFPEGAKLVGFNQEEYVIGYAANLDNALDLQLTYLTSTNIFEDIIQNRSVTGDDYYDKDIVFWVFDDGGAGSYHDSQLGLSNWTDNSGYFFYNFKLTNAEILTRFFGGIPSNILSQLPTTLDERFLAYNTVGQSQLYNTPGTQPDFIQPIVFDEDAVYPAFNTNASYTTATNQFTAQRTGVYSFYSVVNINATSISSISNTGVWNGINFTLIARRYDASINFIADYIIGNHVTAIFLPNVSHLINISGSRIIQMNSSDFIEFRLELTWDNNYPDGDNLTYIIQQNSYAECTSSPEFNFNFAAYDPDDYSPIRFEFNYPLTDDEFRKIEVNPKGYIDFKLSGGDPLTGRIESLKMNHKTGKAQFILNSKKKRIK
jgi:hypothetical protein